jgi:hypothetical protein
MKGSKNFPKVSPEQFAKARDTIKMAMKDKPRKPLMFRNINCPHSTTDSTGVS